MSVQKKTFLLVIATLTIGQTASCRGSLDKKMAMLQADLANHLPVNSGFLTVLAYLDKNRIEHSEYSEAQNTEELNLQGAPGRIDAVVRKVETGLVATADIRITFLFDDHRRMLSYRVFPSIKAP